jgi:nitrate reductase gamma subunit
MQEMDALRAGTIIGVLVATGVAVLLTRVFARTRPRVAQRSLDRLLALLVAALTLSVSACVLVVAAFLAINIIEGHRETYPIEGAYEVLGLRHWAVLAAAIAVTWHLTNRTDQKAA